MLWLVISLHEYFHLTAILVQDIGPGQIILITFISSIAEAFNMSWFTKWFPDCLVFPVSLPYGVGQSGAKSGLFSVGQIPSTSSSIYFRSLLPNVPFRPPPLSSSHLKRQYLTGSSSHQIRDITSYCHNVACNLCCWSVCVHIRHGRSFSFLYFPLHQELS